MQTVSLDHIDRKILGLLQTESGINASAIGERIGRATDHVLRLASDQGAPPVEAQFRATGDRHGLQAEIPEGAALGGTFGGRLTWSWEGALPLSAALRFDDIETAALAPGWPGRLGGELALAGELEPLALDVDVARVQGELRGAEVFGEGRVRLAGQRLRFDGFTLRAGDSRVTLHGDAAAAEGVAFEVEIRIPAAQSLKDRRQVVRSLLDGARHRFGVSAAEVEIAAEAILCDCGCHPQSVHACACGRAEEMWAELAAEVEAGGPEGGPLTGEQVIAARKAGKRVVTG